MVLRIEATSDVFAMAALWEYIRITGGWVKQRTCQADTSEQWLALFQADEPHESCKLSKHRLLGKPQ
jgi:hypothetical protein